MKILNKFIYYYSKNIKIVTISTTSLSICFGVTNELCVKPPNTPPNQLKNLVKYSMFGIITSLTFPISFPIIWVSLLYNYKTK